MSTLMQIIDTSLDQEAIEAVGKLATRIAFRLSIDMLTIFILVRYIYYPIYRHREFFFMFTIFNLIIFLVSFLLNKVELSMGAAFGLFAVFSMLRYRTENVTIKDMTYLFLCIAVGLVSAVTKIKGAPDELEYVFLAGINASILLVTYLLESRIFVKKELAKMIIYENIELIQSGRNEELLEDIRKRTGINVHRVSVQQINFLKDSAQLKIYYYD